MKYDGLKYGDKELSMEVSLAIEKALCSQIRQALEQMKTASDLNDTESFMFWSNRYVEYSNALAEITRPDLFKAYLNNIQIEVGTL